MRFHHLLLPLLIALAPLPARAAEDGKPDKPAGRRVWFVATSIPDGIDNPIQVMIGKDVTEVTLSKRMASNAVKIPADGLIRVVKPAPTPEAEDKPTFVTLAEARIPDSVTQALIILVPAPKEEAPLVFRTKVQDLAAFTGGDTLYMNLTSVNVAVQVGEKKIPLKPGAVRIYDAPRLQKPVNTPISYHFFNPKQERWRLLSASTVVLRPTRREICIFSWDPRYKRLDYHGVTFPVTP